MRLTMSAVLVCAIATTTACASPMKSIHTGAPPGSVAPVSTEAVAQPTIFPPSDPAPTKGLLPKFTDTPTEGADSVRARLAKMRSLKGAVELGSTCDTTSFADWETNESGIFPLAWGINGTCRFIGWQLTSEWRPKAASSDGTVQRAFVYGDDGVAFAAIPLPDPLPADFPLPTKVKLAAGLK
jgi:hypothetical protein